MTSSDDTRQQTERDKRIAEIERGKAEDAEWAAVMTEEREMAAAMRKLQHDIELARQAEAREEQEAGE